MASEKPIQVGKVNIGKGKNKRKKSYAKLFKASDTGLSRLEIYDDEKSSVKGITTDLIVCGEVVKIMPEYPGSSKSEFLFGLLAKENNMYVFGVQDSQLRNDWVKNLGSILFRGQQNNNQSSRVSVRHNTITDNDIYDSAEEYVRDHRVRVSEETAKRLSIQPCKVKLVVESGNITIIGNDGMLVGRWGIEHLRRFGYSDNDFHFEAGRKSELGPGLFSFNTDKGKSIHMMVTREKQACRDSRMNPQGETDHPQPVPEQNMDYDGVTYEELSVTQQPSHKPSKGVTPHKPPRNNVDQQSPTTNPGPAFYSNMPGTTDVYSEVKEPHNAWQNHARNVEDEEKVIYEDQVYEYDHMKHTTPTNNETDLYDSNQSYSREQPDVPVEQLYAVVNKKK